MDPTTVPGTSLNKAIVAVLVPLLAWLNQRYGFALPVDPELLTVLVGAITAAAVYIVPNRVTSSQAAAVVAATKTDPVVQAKVEAIEVEKVAAADEAVKRHADP
jgi:hypothetical protein